MFAHIHALIFALIEEGPVDGLRLDHIDGLLDPKLYLETLRALSAPDLSGGRENSGAA
ncbi:hypothetical protein N8D56_16745 [Devosia sp. A8/3-2]|nr:hypothetical protein N8D56_16745 [Devosia sp. A8/3-2]